MGRSDSFGGSETDTQDKLRVKRGELRIERHRTPREIFDAAFRTGYDAATGKLRQTADEAWERYVEEHA